MFMHNKRLQYTVRVSEPNPRLATMMMEQFGGADGELAAAMRYFTQGLGEDDAGRKDLLLDIATEELSHLEVIGSIVAMLNKGLKAQLAEGTMKEAELYQMVGAAGITAKESILFGGAPALCDSAGVPWTAAYIDSRGEPTVDLRSNIAAEARAKIVYERLINLTDDIGVKDALGFLMTREISHQQSFEKALYSIQPNFPPGKLPGKPEFTNVYFNMSVGEGDAKGPWNTEPTFEFRDAEVAVDGGSGMPEVTMSAGEAQVAEQAAARLASDPASNPVTGAMLGMGGSASVDGASVTSKALDPQAAKKKALNTKSGSTSSSRTKR
jgi:Mn-containing catalase